MLAGQGFFDWVRKETDWEVGEIKSNFSQRLAWIINAVKDQGIQFNSVIIGGGNAAYINQFKVEKTSKNHTNYDYSACLLYLFVEQQDYGLNIFIMDNLCQI
jgi:hypothetical protein